MGYFPQVRQKDAHNCQLFVIHDIETLLETPPFDDGYSEESSEYEEIEFNIWSPVILEAASMEAVIEVNGVVWEGMNQPSNDEMKEKINKIINDHLLLTHKHKALLRSGSFHPYKLVRFPKRFLELTQSRKSIEQLISSFTKKKRYRILKSFQKSLGMLKIAKEITENVNISAELLRIQLIIDLLEGMANAP